MEHLVEPVPINRFSRFAVDKTMPGLLAGVLNAYLAPENQTELTKVQDIQKAIFIDRIFTEEDIKERVLDAFGINLEIYSPSLINALKERVNERFTAEIRRLRSPGSQERITEVFSRKPMTSLRDIDVPVPFEPKEYTYSTLMWISR
jgi:hypothetical protein